MLPSQQCPIVLSAQRSAGLEQGPPNSATRPPWRVPQPDESGRLRMKRSRSHGSVDGGELSEYAIETGNSHQPQDRLGGRDNAELTADRTESLQGADQY